MNNSHAFVGFCLILVAASFLAAEENDLFSKVRTESVYTPSTQPAESAPDRRSPQLPELEVKITSTGELARKLRLAGFETEEDAENRMVSTKTKLGPWTFPVLIVLSEDDSQLMMAMLLSSVSSESQIPKAKLLGLLQANRKYAPASFGYSAKRRRTELYVVLKNRLINSGKLRDEIDRMARIAAETDQLWDLDSSAETPATGSAAAQPAANPSTTAPQEAPSLVGKWVSNRSANEAFAIQFNADGTFLLAYVKNSQQSQSSGKYTLENQTLSLSGKNGLRLEGTISSQSEKQFRFQPTGSASLDFKRAS